MKIRYIIFCFMALFAISSCDDMFEPAEENNRTEDAMIEESDYAYGLLMYGYNRLPYVTTTQTDIATDDAVTNLKTSNYLNMATGAWAADNNPLSQWDNCKDGIQYVNKFLTKVNHVHWAPSSKVKDQMFKERMRGEAMGLRAIFYYHLLQAHAGYADDGVLYGVPLLTEPEDGSSDYNRSRDTFDKCVNQIFADCDSAMALLPGDYEDIEDADFLVYLRAKYGKDASLSNYNSVFGKRSKNLVSGKIAAAIKAQAALLAISPAYRDGCEVTAAQAAKYCADALAYIDGIAGFDESGNRWYRNKSMIESTSEMAEILWREDRKADDNDQEKDNFPPTLYGNGRVNPSQNLVDAFPMLSGLPITDTASGYDPQNPYANRDPRLEMTVIYNGQSFKNSVIKTGVDMPNAAGETDDNLNKNTSTSTRTGYYLKKLLREDVSTSPNAGASGKKRHVYPRIRYTEIFLAYAEAANEAWGANSDPAGIGYTAYDVIKKIRERAGLGKDDQGRPLPQGDVALENAKDDKDKMRELIRNERRLELCFENKRFWDLRRWMLPINEAVKGITIKEDPVDAHLIYEVMEVEDRVFNSSYQWYGPIPKGEVLKWSNLKQNKGW